MNNFQLHKRSDLHLARKLFHLSGGILILYPFLILGKSQEWMAAMLGIILATTMSIEYARNRWEWFNIKVLQVGGPILRDSEVKELSGVPFYMASCLFAILIFPYHIAVLSILYLVLGDPSSSFFGVLWGRDQLFPNKSLQGTLGGFFVCMAATYTYLQWTGLAQGMVVLLSMIGGF